MVWVWWDYTRFLERPMPLDAARTVIIAPGIGATGVVDALEAEGLIDSPTYLSFYLWRSGKGRSLKAGTYRVEPGLSVETLIARMAEGETSGELVLPVPEGSNLYELAQRFEMAGLGAGSELIALAHDPALLARLGVEASSLEGRLFPATYRFAPGADAEQVLTAMHARFASTWSALLDAQRGALARLRETYGLTPGAVLILASLIEEEAVRDDERAVIGRVFLNRLQREMKLQTDPTCVYPPRRVGERPTPERCRDPDNPYSTYVIEGLPPGAISNPGRESMEAALHPYDGPQASHYLFFVARQDSSGAHYFSSTYDEHRAAVDHFLRGVLDAPPTQTPQPPRAPQR